jgi:hypothetical protein
MTTSRTILVDPMRPNPPHLPRSRLLAPATWRALSPSALWELVGLIAVICGGIFIHAYNAFNYPRYQGDEGVYMSAAWSVAHGRIFPYTYSYGHPPLAWMLIAAWCQLTGGFFTFGTAINTGRILMLGVYACSALFVHLIARRLSRNLWVGLLATTLFSFSALSVYYQREILLDNFATFWVLVACYLQVVSESRLRYIAASAFAYGVGVLSKETMIVLFPVFVYGTWLQTSRFQRTYLLIAFGYLVIAVVSTFILLAALKNELFPTGTLLGGSNPHVSLITTFLSQAGRGSGEGSFGEQWGFWQRTDALLMITGTASIAANMLLSRLKAAPPGLRLVELLPLMYLAFLLRGGVTFAHYIIPLIPFLALNLALCAYNVVSLGALIPWRSNLDPARWLVPPFMLLAMALLLPFDVRMNRTNLTANETAPQVAAMQWMGEHVRRSAMIIASHYDWLDMRADGGLGATYGAPFAHIEMYATVAADPAISTGVFHNDWNTVDYIMADSDMMIDAKSFHMTLLLGALQHSVPIKTFQNQFYWVTIYEVQHTGRTDTSTPTLVQEVNQLLTGSATGMPGSAPTSASSGG